MASGVMLPFGVPTEKCRLFLCRPLQFFWRPWSFLYPKYSFCCQIGRFFVRNTLNSGNNTSCFPFQSFLVAQSPYFAALLNTDQFTEVTTSTKGNLTFVTLTNIRAEIFALILKFIYSGITDVS